MIASLTGVLGERDGDTVLIRTTGGVGYAVTVPLGVFERLPPAGSQVSLYTELVVREDAWSLFGFDTIQERAVFQRLLGASGFGPKLALALLSTLGPDRAVHGIRDKDIAVLSSVSGIGRKKAERLILELRDRFEDLEVKPATLGTRAAVRPGEDALKALGRLGYAPAVAEEAVRQALTEGSPDDTPHLIRRALQRLAATRGG
jgi:Holliday junction DNA helicase RuvA